MSWRDGENKSVSDPENPRLSLAALTNPVEDDVSPDPGHTEWESEQMRRAVVDLDGGRDDDLDHGHVFAELDRIIQKREQSKNRVH